MALSFTPHPVVPAAAEAALPLAGVGRLPSPIPAAAQPSSGSRRRRLWELEGHAHCPVLGVCLPLPSLRRQLSRLCTGPAIEDDYELHCTAVAECKRRTPLAEALQREMDRRFSTPLRESARLKTTEALSTWWEEASRGQAVAGAFWATLTHPRCDAALEQRVLGAVHMLQHQVGMATRADLARLEELLHENAVLARELAGAQQRGQRQAEAQARRQDAEREALQQVRTQAAAAQADRERLAGQLHRLQACAPDLPGRLALQQENLQLAEQVHALQRALLQSRQEAERLQRRSAALADELQQARGAPALPTAPDPGPGGVLLQDRAVLCVGGRPAIVPVYRRLVEDTGGRFLHHDGGDEDHIAQLDATLAAADLVICQTGCVSHDAYWRVKDHCKRTGKRCVFVETPSRSALLRALGEASQALERAAAPRLP